VTGPLLLPVREVAAQLSIGRDTAYELVRSGRLRSVAIGRRRLIPFSELEDFVRRESEGNGTS